MLGQLGRRSPRGRTAIVDFGDKKPNSTEDVGSNIIAAFRLGIPLAHSRPGPEVRVRSPPGCGQQPERYVPTSGNKASDMRFHYAVHDGSGNPVNNIGELSALIQDKSGKQILVGSPCQQQPKDRPDINGLGKLRRIQQRPEHPR